MLDFDTDLCQKYSSCHECEGAAAAPSDCQWANCSSGEYQSVDVTLHNHGHCVGWMVGMTSVHGGRSYGTGYWLLDGVAPIVIKLELGWSCLPRLVCIPVG